MRQLFDWVRDWRKESIQELPPPGGQNTPAGTIATDWGHLISGYVKNLYGVPHNQRRYEKARKEIDARGLAFGQIKINGCDAKTIQLSLLGTQKITLEQVECSLKKALEEKWLDTKIEVKRDAEWGRLEAICLNDELPGINWCGIHNGEPFNHKEFLAVHCWSGGGLREMVAHSPEATCVLVRVAEILGFPAGPKHYAHESLIKIEDIVVFAARWEDPKSGCRYLDVLLRKVFVKHQVWHGSNSSHEYTEDGYSGEVLACKSYNGDWWPKITINNCPVYATIITVPTRHMIQAREKFIRESLRVCEYCGEPAIREFHFVRVDMGDSTIGSIGYTCDKQECRDKIKEVKSLRITESLYIPERW